MNNTTAQIRKSCNTIINALDKSKEIVHSAVEWSHVDLSGVSSFLGIINTTISDSKYHQSAEKINLAKEEVEKLKALLEETDIPAEYKEQLAKAAFPEELPENERINLKISEENYNYFCSCIATVNESVVNILKYFA